ncbi:MAG: hypothetical protein ACHQXA_10585 [Gemmatimonadales bacterium]
MAAATERGDNPMGAVAATVIVRKEKEIVSVFRQAGVTSVATARSSEMLGLQERVAWRLLIDHAVIRPGAPGTWYLDEPSWEAFRRMRRRMALVILAIVLIAALGTWTAAAVTAAHK